MKHCEVLLHVVLLTLIIGSAINMFSSGKIIIDQFFTPGGSKSDAGFSCQHHLLLLMTSLLTSLVSFLEELL